MRTNPHILEVNTRLFLKRLEKKLGQTFTLDTVPLSYWEEYKALGFDAVWLMGVWQASAAAKEIAKNQESVNNTIKAVYPNYSKDDIIASPFAVYDYNVDASLGGNDSLKRLKETLNNMGISVLLDFVGNHLAMDHPKTLSNPEFFINTGLNEPPADKKNQFFKTKGGVWIAHGKDPYFPPWTDTAQLNYFNPDARKFILENLQRVAAMCDGVRCDMAMLSLNKVHNDIWRDYVSKYPYPQEEFWRGAVNAVREKDPDFVFIAEVYWGLEWEIQELGFDYTYDKILYDRLRYANPESIKGHLNAEHLYQRRSIRFISNHDEEAAIKAFGKEKSFAAASIISTISGARMFHMMQLVGRKNMLPIQYIGNGVEDDKEVFGFYQKLLTEVNAPAYHGGQWSMREIYPDGNNPCFKNVLSWSWAQANTHKLVIINYCDCESVCYLDTKKLNIANAKEAVATHPLQGNLSEWLKGKITLKPFEIKIVTM